jgi:hypothetical protein
MAAAVIRYNDAFAEKWLAYLSPEDWRLNVSLEFLDVPFSALRPAGCHTDPDVVDGWYAMLKSGKSIAPPIVTATPDGHYYVHDGNHRYEAIWAYLGGSVSEATVRVALVVPNSGFRFDPIPVDPHVVTYELRAVRRGYPMIVGLPLSATVLAVLTTSLLPGADQGPFFGLMLVAVLISARFGGLISGIIAVLCNIFAAAYFMLPPLRSVAVEDQVHAVQLAVSAIVMLAIVALSLQWKTGLIPARFWKGTHRH